MQFARDDCDTSTLQVYTLEGGTVVFLTGFPEGDERYFAPLHQVVQLRDFLNRHIDTLALKSIGASAYRASDDPGQLPAEAEITASTMHVQV